MNERKVVCADLGSAIGDLQHDGFRLDLIYPADEPHTAVLSNATDSVRLTSRPDEPLPGDALPRFDPQFVLTRAEVSPARGRAGMLYRDLIPGRLGGRYIASHITIPQGGPVADWVHFHHVTLQMIFVARGWVRVVYEDQGEPFVIEEGDLVLQPPQIRHRVLESSEGAEVIEIGAPALHATYSEHSLELPNGRDPERVFSSQRFLHHKQAEAPWTPFGGGQAQPASVAEATASLADVRTIRSADAGSIDFHAHAGELVFGFVLDGSALLEFARGGQLGRSDAFVIPPGEAWRLSELTPDFRLLHVTTSQLD